MHHAKLAVLHGGKRTASVLLGQALLMAGRPHEAAPWLQRGTEVEAVRREDLSRVVYGRRQAVLPLPDALPRLVPDAELDLVRQQLDRTLGALAADVRR